LLLSPSTAPSSHLRGTRSLVRGCSTVVPLSVNPESSCLLSPAFTVPPGVPTGLSLATHALADVPSLGVEQTICWLCGRVRSRTVNVRSMLPALTRRIASGVAGNGIASLVPDGTVVEALMPTSRLNGAGVIAPEILTDDSALQGIVAKQPGLRWKAFHVRQRLGLAGDQEAPE
jgi:hypothetical protein